MNEKPHLYPLPLPSRLTVRPKRSIQLEFEYCINDSSRLRQRCVKQQRGSSTPCHVLQVYGTTFARVAPVSGTSSRDALDKSSCHAAESPRRVLEVHDAVRLISSYLPAVVRRHLVQATTYHQPRTGWIGRQSGMDMLSHTSTLSTYNNGGEMHHEMLVH